MSAGKTTCSVRARSCSTWFDRNLRTRSQVVLRPPKGSASVGSPRLCWSERRQILSYDCAPWSRQAIWAVKSAPMLAPNENIEMPWLRGATALLKALDVAARARRGTRLSGHPPSSHSGGRSQAPGEEAAGTRGGIGGGKHSTAEEATEAAGSGSAVAATEDAVLLAERDGRTAAPPSSAGSRWGSR